MLPVFTVPVPDSPPPIVRVPSKVHHGKHLDGVLSDTVDHTVRKAMDEVSPDRSSLISERPYGGRFAHGLDSSIHLDQELRPQVLRTFFVPRARVLKLAIHIGVDINAANSRSGRAGL